MTVDAIRFQNFMAFEDTDWIDLSPITLLFGRNSSGKSVLIRALLLLRQSVQQARDGDVFVFASLHGINIGGFQEMVHNQKEGATVRFYFRCTSSNVEDILSKSKHSDIKRRATSTLQVALGYTAGRKDDESANLQQLHLSNIEIYVVNAESRENDLLFRAVLLDEEDVLRFGEEWYVDGYLTSIEENKTWEGFSCQVGRGFIDVQFKPPANNSTTSYEILERLLGELKQEIQSFLEQIVHLGPVRPEPQRRYSFNQADIAAWKARGWTAFLDFVGGHMGREQIREINAWLRRLELAAETEPRLTSEMGSLYTEFEVAIREHAEQNPLPLSAMGFGLSQVLPIVVQCVAAHPGSLVIIEQPELHLHPKAQAQLTDLFIAMSQRGLRFMIETHSEHLLLRLRRRIAETTAGMISDSELTHMTSDKLQAYFIDRVDDSSTAEPVIIDRQGKMSSPSGFRGFFADDLQELASLNQAILGMQKQ